jgi:basic membrane lipoprotein Med (substrate-binding protein (PBP1-ABC) superfamily)
MKRFQSFAVVLTLLAIMVGALAVGAQDSLIDSICLVTDIGRINDGTFNEFTYNGFARAAEDFGLDSTFIETAAPTDYDTNMSTCVDEGYDVIVTVGFLMTDKTAEFANANPDVYFIGIDQFHGDAPDNLLGVLFREDQSGFLAGALAAMMSESGIIAGVYGIDIPPVVKFRNGFEQGARYINPDIETLGVYIDSFGAPDRGAAAAEGFIGEGADVIFGAGGNTGSGGITKAAQLGALVIGVDQDEYNTTFGRGETPGAENLISSAMKRVDNGAYLPIKALAEGGGDWVSGIWVLSAENDGIGFAPPHDSDVSEEVTAAMEEIYQGLKDGSIETGVNPGSGELLEMDMMDDDMDDDGDDMDDDEGDDE